MGVSQIQFTLTLRYSDLVLSRYSQLMDLLAPILMVYSVLGVF